MRFRTSVKGDIDRELRFHLEQRVDELMARGVAREEAKARAVEEFGDVESVRASLLEIDEGVSRRQGRLERLGAIRQDLGYAVRALRRTPAVSLTIILTLALGIGANAAMFSLLDVIYLRAPAGVTDADPLRRVWSERRFTSGTQFWSGFDYSGYAAVAAAAEGRADATLYSPPAPRKLARGENAPTVNVSGAASSYFTLLGLRPALGRFYQPDEDALADPAPVAVISERFWRREYGGQPDVLGREISLGGQPFIIVGVAPAGFRGVDLDAADVWLPIATSLGRRAGRGAPWWQNPNVNGFQVVLRVHSGVSDQELLPRLTRALRQPGVGYAQDTLAVAGLGAINASRGPGKVSTEMKVATRLAGVALVVLLVAVANVVNLLLARAVNRRREIAVRLALGISRWRLVRLLVTESVLLSLAAGGAALVAAWWGSALLRALLLPEVEWHGATLHWRVLIFALAAALLAGVAAGLVPALQAASPELAGALRDGARAGTGSRRRARLRSFLVGAQGALSVVLLVGAVLFVRSLRNVKAHDVGYSVDRLIFATATYDTRDSVRDAALAAHLSTAVERMATLPGVERVALTSMRPKWGMSFTSYFIEGDTVGRRLPDGIYTAVTPAFFATVGMRLTHGRTFTDAGSAGSPPEVIVNEAMAHALWPGLEAIGQCIRLREPTAPCATVIGVAQTAILDKIDEDPRPQLYVPLDQPSMQAWGAPDIMIRADPGQVAMVVGAVRDLLRAELPGATPRVNTMAEAMAPEYRPWELGARLFTLFGVLALLVAAIGTYSTSSYAVTQRTHEFGVRMALGARATDVVRQVVSEGLRTALVGVAAGIVLALAAGRLVAALLYGIEPRDPATLAVVAGLLVVVGVVASLVPAWRAAHADPLDALRAD